MPIDLRQTDLYMLLEAAERAEAQGERLAYSHKAQQLKLAGLLVNHIDEALLPDDRGVELTITHRLTDLGRAVLEALRNDERYRALKAYEVIYFRQREFAYVEADHFDVAINTGDGEECESLDELADAILEAEKEQPDAQDR